MSHDVAAPGRGRPGLRRLLERVTQVRPDEFRLLAWSFLYFFCLLAAYYMIRPLRDEMAVQYGAERLQHLFSATFLTMVALIPAFGWVASRLPVQRLLPLVYGLVIPGAAAPRGAGRLARGLPAGGRDVSRLSTAPPRPFATTLGERVISVASFSKAYGLPGLRVGWLMTRDPLLNETFLAAKEQMLICGAVLDEEIAYRVYARRREELPRIAAEVGRGRGSLAAWMKREPALEWVEPAGGVVAFPRIRADAAVNVPRFYETLNGTFATFVGPGHWFEQDDRFMRIGFGWPTPAELEEGLANISASLRAAQG